MKLHPSKLLRLASTGAAGLALAQSIQAATTVTFDGFTQNSTIGANAFADNVAAAGTGVAVSMGAQVIGTPNLDVTWNLAGLTQFYNSWDSRGSVAQLEYLAAGAANPIQWSLTPTAGIAAVVTSFDLDVWGGGGAAAIEWAVSGSLSGALASGTWTRNGNPTGGRDTITPNVTGQAGEVLTLTFRQTGGLGNYLALDNLAFDQVAVPEPATSAAGLLGLGALALRRRRSAR